MRLLDSIQPHSILVVEIEPTLKTQADFPRAFKKKSLKKSIIKICAALLIVALNASGLLSMNYTFGYLSDTESSSNNVFAATILDLELDADPWQAEGEELNLMPDGSVTRSIDAANAGVLPFNYNASTTNISGDLDLCAALKLKVEQDGVEIFDGDLINFISATSTLSFLGSDNWLFTLTLPATAPDALQNKTCQFKFFYSAWQENFLNSFFGFRDNEEVDNTVQTGTWIVNEQGDDAYRPIADSYVDQQSTGQNPKSDQNFGSNSDLIVQARNNRNQRTFIKFDFHFPFGTLINSSSLNLYMHSAPTANSRTYEARRALADWSESAITWNNQPLASSTVTATTATVDNSAKWLDWNVLTDVQSFANGSSTNYGWRIGDSNESENENSQIGIFYSRESAGTTTRPYLDVSFTAPIATTSHLVINEVYYNVAASGAGAEPNNEWIEIYNPTAAPVDISGWQIVDNNSTSTIPAGTPAIPAKGFAVISGNASTWGFWSIPAGAILIDLPGTQIGNSLNNNGDRLFLKNAANVTIDAMSYGNDISQFSLPSSGEGDSLARIVKGYDTDTADDWVINAAPNPGTNPSGDDGIEIMRFTDEGILVASSLENLELLVAQESGDDNHYDYDNDTDGVDESMSALEATLPPVEALNFDVDAESDNSLATSSEEIIYLTAPTPDAADEILIIEESSVPSESLETPTPTPTETVEVNITQNESTPAPSETPAATEAPAEESSVPVETPAADASSEGTNQENSSENQPAVEQQEAILPDNSAIISDPVSPPDENSGNGSGDDGSNENSAGSGGQEDQNGASL